GNYRNEKYHEVARPQPQKVALRTKRYKRAQLPTNGDTSRLAPSLSPATSTREASVPP
ncbi:hypothetical protein HAX54_002667, partial [Datura stramonium]|nr:hypothetical protein [Datura stramonium]